MTPTSASGREHPIPVRLPSQLVARLDALRSRLVAEGMAPASRSAVLRVAVERGVSALEVEHPSKRSKVR